MAEKRNIFDAHIHLMPARLVGETDAFSGARYDRFGRVIKADGVVLDYMPVPVDGGVFSAEALIHLMDLFGVQRAMILQSSFFRISRDVAEAVAKYPDRLSGAMSVTPDWGATEEMAAWRARGLTAIKFEMRGLTEPHRMPDLKMDAPFMMAIFEKAGQLNVTAVVDPGPIGWPCYQPEALERAVRENPATRFVICHLGLPFQGFERDGARFARWKQMLSLARFENVWFDVSAMPDLFAREGYPFTTAMRLIADFHSTYGAEKTIWGSDAPGALRNATYAQSIAMFERDARFGAEALERILYKNACDAYL